MKNIKALNQAIEDKYFTKNVSPNFQTFLGHIIPEATELEGTLVNDNIEFYKVDKKIYSIRVNLKTKSYQHLDFYLEGTKRPYKRAYLNQNRQISSVRYYELGTWQVNYDVYYCPKLVPIYTVEHYLNKDNVEKMRYIDWRIQPGFLTYSKAAFLEHMNNFVSGS